MQQAPFQDLQNPLQNKNIENMGAWFMALRMSGWREQSVELTQGPFECRALCDHPGSHHGDGPRWRGLCPELVSPPQGPRFQSCSALAGG